MSKVEPERLADLDPLLADYASALREVDSPEPDRAEATWAAVRVQTRPRARLWAPVVIAAAAILVGIVAFTPSTAMEEDEPTRAQETPFQGDPPTTQGVADPRPRPAETPKPPKSEPRVVAPEPEPEPVAPSPARARHSEPTPTPGPSSLAQETALLREIQKAQAAGQSARVLELTRDHAERFPEGTFAAERTLARVRALCRLDRTADARAASERFIRQHPASHLRPQFETACPE